MLTFKKITIATIDSNERVALKKDIDVKIKDNIIAEVGKNLRTEGKVIRGDYFLTPGFIQGHVHPTNILNKGTTDRLDWKELVEELHKSKFDITREQRVLVAIQCFLECVKAGATTCLTASSTWDEIFYANKIVKNRVFAFGMPKDMWRGGGKVRIFDKERIKEMFSKCSVYNNELFSSHFGIASLRAASDSLIDFVLDNAISNQKMFKIHVAQSRIDLETTFKERNSREVEYLYKKFKNKITKLGKRSFFTHAAIVNKNEIGQIKELGANVVICAGAMAKIGTGFAPLKEYMKSGINLLLGTDTSINNDSNNILAEAQFAALAYKAKEKDASFLTSEDIFKMLTANGERAGLGKIGRIERGYLADINVFDLNTYPFVPALNHLNNLVFNGFNIRPICVLINGEFAVKNYKSILNPEDELLKKYHIRTETDLLKTVKSFRY